MNDSDTRSDDADPPAPLVVLVSDKAFGKLVVQWSLDPSTRPDTLQGLKDACINILEVPDRITKLQFVDVGLDTLLISIPHKKLFTDALKADFAKKPTSEEYPAPAFYDQLGEPDSQSALDTLHCRIGDYSCGQCQ